jgi:carbohydrate-binding DOMON domain-containing protein
MVGMRKILDLVIIALILVSLAAVFPQRSAAQTITTLFEMEDPVDDDHGIDDFMYPEHSRFAPGVFDLTYFAVRDDGTNIVFDLTFRTLGGNPLNGPNGFSLQLIEIYVNDGTGTERSAMSVSDTETGDTAQVRIENGWKWAVRANGWPRGYGGRYNTHGRWATGDIFDVQVSASQATNTVTIKVPKSVVGSPSEAQPWYCTVLTGADNAGAWRKMILYEKSLEFIRWLPDPSPARADWQSRVIWAGVEPRPLDILAPFGLRQKDILLTFNENLRTYAKVLAVGPIPGRPYFTVAVTPSSGIVEAGKSVTISVDVRRFLGYSQQVTLTATGLPQGMSATFSPESGTPPFTSSLTISTSRETPTGVCTVYITASGGSLTSAAQVKLWVAERVFEITDPVGDDYGPGNYKYPQSAYFAGKQGLFDVTKFMFFEDAQNYYFAVTFSAEMLGGNIWSGEAGFSYQLVEVWIDCKPGGETVPFSRDGPRIKIEEKHAWDFGLQISGFYKPHKAKRNWVVFAGELDVVTGVLTVSADLASKTIVASLPKSVVVQHLGSLPADYTWHAVVISGSQDGFSEYWSWRVALPEENATEAEKEWKILGANPQAYSAGVSPNVMDIVLPAGRDQRKVLSGYNTAASGVEGYAVVPAFSLAAAPEKKPTGFPVLPVVGVVVMIVVLAAVIILKRK